MCEGERGAVGPRECVCCVYVPCVRVCRLDDGCRVPGVGLVTVNVLPFTSLVQRVTAAREPGGATWCGEAPPPSPVATVVGRESAGALNMHSHTRDASWQSRPLN